MKGSKKTKVDTPKFKPIGERVLVSLKKPEQMTKGGIIIPDSVQKKQKEPIGVVSAVSDSIQTLEIGETIMYGANSGVVVFIDGIEFAIVNERDVYGVFVD